jgi:hypothetical protein
MKFTRGGQRVDEKNGLLSAGETFGSAIRW